MPPSLRYLDLHFLPSVHLRGGWWQKQLHLSTFGVSLVKQTSQTVLPSLRAVTDVLSIYLPVLSQVNSTFRAPSSGRILFTYLVTCIQGDSGGICNTLRNDSMCDSKQKKFIWTWVRFWTVTEIWYKEDTDHPASTNSNYVLNNITTNITCIVIRRVNHDVLLMSV